MMNLNTCRNGAVIFCITLLLSAFNNCSAPIGAPALLSASSSSLDASTPQGNAQPFTCTDPTTNSPTKSLSLTKTQFSNTITDLFGSAALTAAAGEVSSLSEEVNDLSTFNRQSQIDSAQINGFSLAADAIAKYAVQTKAVRDRVFGTCASLAAPTSTCIDGFLNSFASKIIRRPLNTGERTFAKNLANQSGDYLTNLTSVLSYFLQSPHFLWRIELGSSFPVAGKLKLTDFEVATRIAFEATDSTPDDTLLAAATSGALANPTEIRTQTLRLLKTARGQTKVAATFVWWSMADQTKDIASLPAAITSGVNMAGLPAAMTAEVATFVKQTIFIDNGSFRDLLTSKKSFASHSGLAAIYGHAPVAAVATPATFPNRRQGLLMRAPFLSWDTFRTSIIHRGVDFQKRYLCNVIPQPTVAIADDRLSDILPDSVLLSTSNRDSITYQTKNAVCMSCHSTINPTGFAFENFDPLGRIRSQESILDASNAVVNTSPVDSGTVIPLSGGKSLNVTDAYDLVTYVAGSSEGAACMARSLYRFVNEKVETTQDDCDLQRVHSLISDQNQPIVDALVELIANPHANQKVY